MTPNNKQHVRRKSYKYDFRGRQRQERLKPTATETSPSKQSRENDKVNADVPGDLSSRKSHLTTNPRTSKFLSDRVCVWELWRQRESQNVACMTSPWRVLNKKYTNKSKFRTATAFRSATFKTRALVFMGEEAEDEARRNGIEDKACLYRFALLPRLR